MPDKIEENLEIDINSDKKVLYMGFEVLERVLGKERKERFLNIIRTGEDDRIIMEDDNIYTNIFDNEEVNKVLDIICDSLNSDTEENCKEMIPNEIDKFLREYR